MHTQEIPAVAPTKQASLLSIQLLASVSPGHPALPFRKAALAPASCFLPNKQLLKTTSLQVCFPSPLSLLHVAFNPGDHLGSATRPRIPAKFHTQVGRKGLVPLGPWGSLAISPQGPFHVLYLVQLMLGNVFVFDYPFCIVEKLSAQ